MKVVGLVSGGKDSCYAMMKCIEYGHEIVAVANLLPVEDSVDELDSYMYQTVGHQIVVSYAECMGVPLFRKRIQGSTRHHNLSYKVTAGDEVEDLFILLKEVKKQIPLIEGVSSGAIASDYQRLRVESVCSRLGLISLAFLWKQDQSLLLQEMIGKSIKAIIVKVAAIGLEPKKHLGKEIGHLESYLHKLKELYGINVCGEGGEYETLTLDCPLFKNAQIVLDEFDIVLHSADSIASVGILHPSAFHLEYKQETEPSCDSDRSSGIFQGNNVTVCEVQGDCLESCEVECSTIDQSLDLPAVTNYKLHTSKTRKDDIFSISCCLLNPCKTSVDLQEHLKALLTKVELQLVECGFSWESVLYIHLYISDMNAFAEANATYVSFITHDKCRFGVPSRSTIELPLSEVGLGSAYIEVLVANDQAKRVLHVQSISCWAPSCIGPYSQATLHKEILYMAGQLGLDPPTMLLCGGGHIAELKQALQNSEAVAQSFHCSVSTSSIFLIIYCSKSIPHTERSAMNDELDAFLKRTKLLCSRSQNKSELLDPIILYVLVPDLPKRAFVEVKPVLYVAEDTETNPEVVTQDLCCDTTKTCWGFHHEDWHNSCFQKCVVAEKICAVVLSVTEELVQKICSEPAETNVKRMNRVAQFCIVLINKILSENHFSWSDITNAQIVLDEFDIVLHSADSIASVGILHPSAFHLEYKQETEPSCDSDRSSGIFQGNNVTVCEVQGDCLESCEVECSTIDQSLDLPAVTNYKLHTSKTRKDDIFSISCCLLNPCKTSVDLQEHLKALLTKVELQLVECGFSWESVLYIHLYISDMNAFAEANATYVSFITHDKCRFGVPSRSTIELPLSEVGLGSAYIEVLVANDQAKRVLHVQSISCWAPSCIGPYSQATLHKEILYMAGQLGLDPPTMLLCGGGHIAELKQALQNSEAVAQSFHCSVSTSSIFLIIYCSKSIPHTERSAMNDELDAFLKRTKLLCSRSQNKSELLDPIILYVLVPDLPKRAFVEVKPVLYVAEDTETNPEVVTQDLCCDTTKTCWGFHHEDWHNSCFQKCVVAEKICAVVLSVTEELVQKICSEPAETNVKRMNRVAQFCIVLINKILSENHFSWSDITNLRFHYPTSLQISHESLTQIFMGVFRDFATMNQSIQISDEPIFNLVPVLGAGRSPTSMEDILTCELLAQKS